MAPELVIANAPYKTYPGGVIALRCTDWLGPARGTLSTEVDTLAITDGAVRDTQKVATSIYVDQQGALQDGGDTLVIDLNTIPIEAGLRYRLYASARIEGNWDTTNSSTFRESTNDVFKYACEVGWSFQSDFSGSYRTLVAKPRRCPHYVFGEFGVFNTAFVGTETMYIRAIAQNGTTVEWLLDQLFLLPYISGAGVFNGWEAEDFLLFGGSESLDWATDGADGGDVNGKFTVNINPHEPRLDVEIPGADYQKNPKNELFPYVPIGNNIIQSSHTNAETAVHGYSVHGAMYREVGTFTEDFFTRTVGPESWTVTPEGFAWSPDPFPSTSYNFFTNGTKGVINSDLASGGVGIRMDDIAVIGASIESPDFAFSGTFSADEPVDIGGPGTFRAQVRLWLASAPTARSWFVNLDLLTGLWKLHLGNQRVYISTTLNNGTHASEIAGPYDISSFFAFGSPVGFRIEKVRYLLRIRLWDATGAEPSTWDHSAFIPIDAGGGFLSDIRTYSYTDDLAFAYRAYAQYAFFPVLGMVWTDATEWSTYWDNIVVEYDPYGSTGDVGVHTTALGAADLGTITTPYGAQYMIYWGTRDWTTLNAGSPWIDFESATWSATGSAQLQRSDSVLWYFRAVHAGIVSLNWRSADRSPQGQNRILAGG